MSDWRVQIVRIEKIEKHLGTDNLSIYTVLGDYPVVDRTNKFQVGDLATYVAIDTVVPDQEAYHFLSPKAYQRYEEDGQVKQKVIGFKYPVGSVPESKRIVKAKKFYGVYSQGLLLDPVTGFNEGDSVAEILGMTKSVEQEEDNIITKRNRGANAAPAPKGWSIPYYDIESIRKYISCVENEQDILLTEKLHGSNFSACFDGDSLVVKSRNFYKKFDEDDIWIDASIRYDLTNKLSKYPMLVFFGELVGYVKGFRYDTNIVDGKLLSKVYFFDIYDVKAQRYLDYDQMKKILDELELESTPLIYRGPWLGKEQMYQMAERKTSLGGKHIAEGWVLSLGHERYEPKLNGRVKLKYISEQFNLQK
jgi:RNA ligase (TIGR02306 family)